MKNVLPICVALLFASCHVTKDLSDFRAASSEKALIRWQRKGKSLVYEAVCARSQGGGVVVRLYKQSPAPLGEFRLESNDYFTAAGRLAGRGWAGPASDAPANFSTWLAFLSAYRNSGSLDAGSRNFQSASAKVAYTKSGGKLKVLSTSNTQTREVISAVFN
jgi:hypothetical protein